MITVLLLILMGLYGITFILLNLLKSKNKQQKTKIAFFHPFCNDGGGGQKVLWCMIEALLKPKLNISNPKIAIYSLVQNKEEILQKVKSRFSVDLIQYQDQIQIVYVPGKRLLIPQAKLTMVFHMILPIIYAIACLFQYQPDILYDTTGFASSLFITKILLPSTKTFAYVHYPFISLDMIEKVKQRKADFNNDSSISNSPIKTKLKLIYYQIIFLIYKLNGYFVDFAQTNSSWTHNHMCKIWTCLLNKNRLTKLYPPCSVEDLLGFKKKTSQKQVIIMSLAQFRPQKNHICQIKTLKRLLNQINERKLQINPKLYICGTTRGKQDEEILNNLKQYAKYQNIQNYVEFKVNKPFSQILYYFQNSLIGIHTMKAQHFGISVVQMLAAGLIVVAHNSAGPKQDIIKDKRFLATTDDDYFKKIFNILISTSDEKDKWIQQNRKKAQQFGQIAFQNQFLQYLKNQLNSKLIKNQLNSQQVKNE